MNKKNSVNADIKLIRVGSQWKWGESGALGTLQDAVRQSAASKFFRNKTPIPTETWRDLRGAAHALAFVSAGAIHTELLNDLMGGLDKIISEGGSVADFNAQFDDLVDKFGWALKGGGKAWRARLIVQMNTASAYSIANAIEAKQNIGVRPYASWELGGSKVHRASHVAESSKKIAVSLYSVYYASHQFPLGFGCACFWRTWSAEGARQAGYKIAMDAPLVPGVIDDGFGGDRLKTYLESLRPGDVPAAQAQWWDKAMAQVSGAFDRLRMWL